MAAILGWAGFNMAYPWTPPMAMALASILLPSGGDCPANAADVGGEVITIEDAGWCKLDVAKCSTLKADLLPGLVGMGFIGPVAFGKHCLQ